MGRTWVSKWAEIESLTFSLASFASYEEASYLLIHSFELFYFTATLFMAPVSRNWRVQRLIFVIPSKSRLPGAPPTYASMSLLLGALGDFMLVRAVETAADRASPADTASRPDASANPVSAGAAFMLLTTLGVAIALHPFSGSLIFGPTSRFWIWSPLACAFETLTVWARLSEHIAKSYYSWPWPYDTTSAVSGAFTFHDAALAVAVARMLNEPSGRRREAFRNTHNIDEVALLMDAVVRSINEGFRFRLGVALPILAQYIKIMAMSGIYVPKVAGSLFIMHWLTMEMLFSLVGSVKVTELPVTEIQDLLKRTDELLLTSCPSTTLPHGAEGSDEWPDYHFYPDMLNLFGAILLPGLSIMFGGNKPSWLVALMPQIIQYIAIVLYFRYTPKDRNPGGGVGLLCFAAWVIHCTLNYNSTGTARPNWPWLDWLG